MEIGSGWLDSSGAITGVTSWTVATATASGAPNVTLIVQPGAAQPLTASMDSALADPKKVLPDFAVLTQKITKGAKGQDIGRLEYTGFGYHFLAVVIESRAGAVVATFTVALDRFDALRAEVEPYLLTLQAA